MHRNNPARSRRFPVVDHDSETRVVGCNAFPPHAVSAPVSASALTIDMIIDWPKGDVSPRFPKHGRRQDRVLQEPKREPPRRMPRMRSPLLLRRPDSDGFILIEYQVIRILDRYRQRSPGSPESGGILLGYRRELHLPGHRHHKDRDGRSHAYQPRWVEQGTRREHTGLMLDTLSRAAAALGRKVKVELVAA